MHSCMLALLSHCAAACAATRGGVTEVSQRAFLLSYSQIRGIHKEWRHTPVGHRCGSQFPQEKNSFKEIIYQNKKSYVWAEAKFLNKHWWQSAGTFVIYIIFIIFVTMKILILILIIVMLIYYIVHCRCVAKLLLLSLFVIMIVIVLCRCMTCKGLSQEDYLQMHGYVTWNQVCVYV
jgi:hypothetical protein